jgi:hypothetical protein
VSVVTLYSRPDCHLCDVARDTIVSLGEALGGIELHEVDIESDDKLLARLLERIPVVEVDGRIVAELDLDPEDLRVALGRQSS